MGSSVHAASDNDAPVGDGKLFANLALNVPASLLPRRVDKLGAYIPFAESPLIHSRSCLSGELGIEFSSLRYSA